MISESLMGKRDTRGKRKTPTPQPYFEGMVSVKTGFEQLPGR